MTDKDADADDVARFIAKWKGVYASELSTAQTFALDLCALLGVDPPHATVEQDYMFERPLTFHHADGSKSAGRVDLYKRGAFVLESKKFRANTLTKGFDEAMLRAHSQAQNYARALPASEGRPPFVIVVDVGHRIELFSEFSRSGGSYVPFPDPRSHRISLDDLHRPEIRDRLRRIWTDPLSLDPSRESARVTREIAGQLAELAKSLERSGHTPEAVAQFLMRCLFTMFSEDVRLLPSESFRNLLIQHVDHPDIAMRMVSQLWRDMDTGGFSAVLANTVLQFNGKLFKQPDTLPLDRAQVELLIKAAKAKWEHVEPAIFGTLLERALSPNERHKLGAHYTPRAYVERLVLPTVIEPLRAEWSDAQAAALTLAVEGKHDDAVNALLRFHHRLCTVRVLDPACGSGNFLYVTLEHLKRLEGEVLGALDDLGYQQAGLALGGERADALGGETVDPHNLLGIELNPRAAAIAEVVLWIGYLQWHFRTRGDVNPPTPVIRDFRNIENRDAVLAYDRMEYLLDEAGVPVTRWDGETMKDSPVTGEKIPDESARKPIERYINSRKAEWPQADFVVGNPPYLGARRIRLALGDGYLDALRSAYPGIPEHADFVMYWWASAAKLVGIGVGKRAGLITSNSIRQSFSRKVLDAAFAEHPSLNFSFVVPDHPWTDATDGAAVRVAMTVVDAESRKGRLQSVVTEYEGVDGEVIVELASDAGSITPNLTIGTDPNIAVPLRSNAGTACVGYQLTGQGFVINVQQVKSLTAETSATLIKPLMSGRDITQSPRGLFAIDLFGLSVEQVREKCPAIYQWVLDRVKPERDHNRDGPSRENWWLFARPRAEFRPALEGIKSAIATSLTAKHRTFVRVPANTICDSTIVMFAFDDTAHFGVLSSKVHVTWAIAAGGHLGVGNDPRYNKTRCFEPFPFPIVNDEQTTHIRTLAEHLDAHRKRQQAAHPDLTLTGMYNVLEKLRSGEPLTPKERTIHEHGLVSVLRQLHDDLDAAVLDAYGWSDLLPVLRVAHGNDAPVEGQTRDDAKRAFDETILERLVALNAERAAEEARGQIRWLRPEFQNPQAHAAPEQGTLDTSSEDHDTYVLPVAAAKPMPWPKDTVEQVRAVADLLASSPIPLSLDEIGSRFTARGPWKRRLPQLLDMLVALGRAEVRGDAYVAG
ncbi:DNA methyltransferase [Thermomonas sp.]|uniref:class I SAM-dependent DNA methyltransferase n=1 Tax=Thermomonas sp. TaxID=1971895 RepID=UPI00248A7B13|nr:DNA methyltransferase [Thermomonas sp.]MDI1253191.1 class I SAM-dependent DNA methyltransferase [Thermomonas sp.]